MVALMTVSLLVLSVGLGLSYVSWRFGPLDDAPAEPTAAAPDTWSPVSAIVGAVLLSGTFVAGLTAGTPGQLLFFAVGYPFGASMLVQSWREWRSITRRPV